MAKKFYMEEKEFWKLVDKGLNQNQIAQYKNVVRSTIANWIKEHNINYKFTRWKNLTDKQFGRLKVIKKIGLNKQYKMVWLCQCVCGNFIKVVSSNLLNGTTKSCGCLLSEKTIERNINRSNLYGATASTNNNIKRLSHIYQGMKRRCYNKNNGDYNYYGGRGIKICKEWLNSKDGFINFYDWAINNGYEKTLTIERKDVNGNYSPKNCTWATMKIQGNNKRNNHIIKINNEYKTISEWSDTSNINYGTLISRLHNTNNEENLLSNKNQNITYIEINGIEKSISEWAKEYNLYEKTLYQRYKKLGWRGEKLLQPIKEKNKRR